MYVSDIFGCLFSFESIERLTIASTRSGLSLDRSFLSSGSETRLKRYVAFVGIGGGGAGLVDLVGVLGDDIVKTNR